jgi:putative membrane-bound dehydrogenase-like protein
VTIDTPGHAVDIKVPLGETRELFLVVDDGGDGISCDWADWIDPRLVKGDTELSLTKLDWKTVATDWGQVHKNANAGGSPLRVAGKPIELGIGAHSRSLIHFEIPAGYTHFVARGALDNGGTDQPGGASSSVRFLVFTTKPPAEVLLGTVGGERTPETAVPNLEVHPDLEVSLFAAEPMMLSPSNIDVDHRGRVWVCEVVNYRAHNGKRPEGDRILILEDTDGDGQADLQKVFYQGRDVDTAHGVCVLGNRVIVSAGSQVICFTDHDGDDKPDQKDIWFTGISGVQHDHGIHAFLFGPDGKLYFNFGNEGKQLRDAEGKPIVDLAGNEVSEHRKPYQQGMVFRCNPDLTELETLAWNFRNNWMVTVDSFGTIWQSDNDDDGNRGVRINYVLEFGNYGYRDERTGAGWNTARIGMAADVPNRHWHVNDPGVVPNLLLTGAGSPTGITVYEGDALPSFLHGQLVHCDAGPSVTRAYTLEDDGAGYSAEIIPLLEGKRDHWFRPSDVKVAPDGSLIVADWYDPGVGGHAMGDLQRGRLFRVTAKNAGSAYTMPEYDFTTATGATEALQNPNNAVRYIAWQALFAMGEAAEDSLLSLSKSDKPHLRARAYWLLGKLPGRGMHYVEMAANDTDPSIRCLAIRLARQLIDVDHVTIAERLCQDSSAQVRRDAAIALRHSPDPRAPEIWATLASQHDGQDRWYLEALGIAADHQWDAFLQAWRKNIDGQWNTPAGRDIVWRSRAAATPELLRQIMTDPTTEAAQLPQFIRALDFLEGPERTEVLLRLAFEDYPSLDDERLTLLRTQALGRLRPEDVQAEAQQTQINQLLDSLQGTSQFVDLVRRFRLTQRYDDVLEQAVARADAGEGIEAMAMLLREGQTERIQAALANADPGRQLRLLEVLGRSSDNHALPLLQPLIEQETTPSDLQRAAVGAMSRIRAGAELLLSRAEQDALSPSVRQAAAADLQSIPWGDLRGRAQALFPLPATKDNRPLPSLGDLAGRSGDSVHGRAVFQGIGTCAKCHIVRGEGKQVGPELTEIGDKLSRQAMFESILYPSAGISHSYEMYTAELADGNIVSGVLVSETDEAVELKDSEGIVRRLARADIETLVKQPISLMPADLHQTMTEKDLVDLVEYLTTLKK